ncbi:hypothetical protein ALC53_05912 [Atta colombica]|uniref:Uncharacterized protein n=1 Tax=Atta colombica TaxID=520822 RepID=A0A195BFZ5_9HYME|nr:hypothetical protein ALC53_05912 [Atta colombica]
MIKKLLERWFIRSKIKNKQEALNIRRKLAIIYAIVGWNMFGVLFYKIIKHKMPEDPTERRLSYRLLSETPSNMHVYQVTGLTLTNDFDIGRDLRKAIAPTLELPDSGFNSFSLCSISHSNADLQRQKYTKYKILVSIALKQSNSGKRNNSQRSLRSKAIEALLYTYSQCDMDWPAPKHCESESEYAVVVIRPVQLASHVGNTDVHTELGA